MSNNEGMCPLNRKQKILGLLALAVVVILLAPFVAVQVQERIFRHRAERLLADMRSLMMHKGGAEEMRAMFERWSPYNTGCTGQNCWFHKDLEYGHFSEMYDLDLMNESNRWLRLFRFFGGHPAYVHAHAETSFGARIMSFEMETERSSARFSPESIEQNILRARASIVGGFDIENTWDGLTLHPSYLLHVRSPRPGNMRYPTVSAVFGPNADPADIARLTSFDFSCLTRWTRCREPGDPMPVAAAQFEREEPQIERVLKDHVCGPEVISLMARNAEYAGVVQVIEVDTPEDADDLIFPDLRIIHTFTPSRKWKIGDTGALSIVDENFHRVNGKLPPEVRVGNRFIILAATEWSHTLLFADPCGIVPLNPANLDLVQHAIAGNPPPAKP